MWKIGNVEIKNQVVLAPMAGICNNAFRKIIKEMGAGLICAEMVSDKALVYDSKKTKELLYLEDIERPISQQIFGSDVDTFVEAAKIVYKLTKPDIIDINMGCPVPKVALKSQAGAALLRDPDKIYEIVSSVRKAVPCPIIVKIRSGWDSNNINAVLVAKVCEKAGASAITVHPRTRMQGYQGKADWNIIKEVKQNVKIPVIGNGDITSSFLAKKMLDETGCDAVMIGRGALGNPWLIKEVVAYLEDATILPEPSYRDRINMCYKHLDYLLKIKSEKVSILEMRSHISWYLKSLPGNTSVKKEIMSAKNSEEIKKILNNYLNNLENGIL